MKTISEDAGLIESRMALPVAAIKSGTVLDHIKAGQSLFLLRLLKLEAHHQQITVGLNLPSTRFSRKDLIKVEGWELSPSETAYIAVFSPHTTVNIVQDYKVVRKFSVSLPNRLEGVICCPNKNCITNHEPASRYFHIAEIRRTVRFCCHYCERAFFHEDIINYCV